MRCLRALAAATLVLSLVLSLGCIGSTGSGNSNALQLGEFTFISGEKPVDEVKYEEHSSTYGKKDKVFMYFEIEGYEEKNNNVRVEQRLIAINPEGEMYLNTTVLDKTFSIEEKDKMWLKNRITPPSNGFKQGKHQVKIWVKDKLSNKTITHTEEFEVKD